MGGGLEVAGGREVGGGLEVGVGLEVEMMVASAVLMNKANTCWLGSLMAWQTEVAEIKRDLRWAS